MLKRFGCPMPFHAVRALLLGNIASPRLSVSPMTPVAQAWGGELPEFETPEVFEEVVTMLIQGWWNRLAEHQNSRTPFRLVRDEVAPTRAAVLALTRMRIEELKAFEDGLFGEEYELDFPDKAHKAMQALGELHGMLVSAEVLLADEATPAPPQELKDLLRNLQRMTITADELINKVIQSCKRARAQQLAGMETTVRYQRRGAVEGDAMDADDDLEPDFVNSPLSRSVTRQGVTVHIEIYSGEQGAWILEVVDAAKTSHVWDDPFKTDQEALDEALKAIDADPLEFFGLPADRPLS